MSHQKVRKLKNLFLNLNWKLAVNFKVKQVIRNSTTKKWFKKHKDSLCLKIKLYQKVNSRANRTIMIHIQELRHKNQSNSVLNNNGKLMVNFKEIQVIWMITKDTKTLKNHQWYLYTITNSCQKDSFNQQQTITIVMSQTL